MPRKYFVWSFDDGVVQDRRIVEILREFGLGATFHLNSGLFGAKTFIGHPPTVPHERLEAAEAKELYNGFEIAAHTCTHRDLSACTDAERRREIADDVAALSGLFDREITGFAYPYGRGAAESRDALIAAGVCYARTIETAPDRAVLPEKAAPTVYWSMSFRELAVIDAPFLAATVPLASTALVSPVKPV